VENFFLSHLRGAGAWLNDINLLLMTKAASGCYLTTSPLLNDERSGREIPITTTLDREAQICQARMQRLLFPDNYSSERQACQRSPTATNSS
jgi:hypothetical protein